MKINNDSCDEIKFVIANCLSNFGSSLTYILLILFWTDKTDISFGSDIIVGYLWINIISMIVSGRYIDNRQKCVILRIIQLVCSLFMIFVAFICIQENIYSMIIVFWILAILNGVDASLSSAILPEIVNRNDIKMANTLLQVGTRFLGIFVGIIATWCSNHNGYSIAFIFDSTTYLIAYFTYKNINYRSKEVFLEKNNSYRVLIINLLHDKMLVYSMVGIVLINIALGSFDTLFPQLFLQNGWMPSHYGYVNSAFSLGSFCVTITILTGRNRFDKTSQFYGSIIGCLLMAMSFMFNESFTYFCVGTLGFYSVVMLINAKSYVQINTDINNAGKTMAIMSVMLTIAKPIGVFMSNITAYISNGVIFLRLMSVVLIVYSLIIWKGGTNCAKLSN